MSAKVVGIIFDRYPVGGGEMLLALALGDCADPDGTNIYPSVATLARMTRQSERSVQYQLRRMEASGWLILVNSGRGGRPGSKTSTRQYVINPAWLQGGDFPLNEKGADIAPRSRGAKDQGQGCKTTQKRVQNSDQKGADGLHPTQEHPPAPKEHPLARAENARAGDLSAADIDRELAPLGNVPAFVDKQVLARFVRHRRASNRHLTISGWLELRPILEELATNGHDPNQAMRNAMAAGLCLPTIKTTDGSRANATHAQGSANQVSDLRQQYERQQHEQARSQGGGCPDGVGHVYDGEFSVVQGGAPD